MVLTSLTDGDRWFATVRIVIQQHKIVIQQQIDGSQTTQLSSANSTQRANPRANQVCALRLQLADAELSSRDGSVVGRWVYIPADTAKKWVLSVRNGPSLP